MKNIITAKEASKLVNDLYSSRADLAYDAIDEIMIDLDKSVREAILKGDREASINLTPIGRLTEINLPAMQLAVLVLEDKLKEFGYTWDSFTNHSTSTIIRWDLA